LLKSFTQTILGKSATSRLFESAPLVRGIKVDPSSPAYGTPFSDLYKGQLGTHNVAVKRLRIFDKDERERLHPLLKEKALTWQKLKHPNVLPFYGVDELSLKPFLCLVTLWIENGNALNYLASHQDMLIKPILADIAEALTYLHERKIIHGGLYASNVLISDTGSAILGDYELAPFVTEVTSGMALSGNPTMRYLAPEIHDPARFKLDKAERSTASDVYSFGMLAIQLYTRKVPYADIRNDNSVAFAALEGHRPSRPNADGCPGDVPSDAVWELLERCWRPNPTDRPTAKEVASALAKITA
jgi:serine/threonine protein kinase